MSMKDTISDTGVGFFRGKVSNFWIEVLRKKSLLSFESHYEIQIKNMIENPNKHFALNAIGDCEEYLKFVEYFIIDQEIEEFLNDYFESNFILNSFSILNSCIDDDNFSHRIHRDSREYMNQANLMLNFLILLDDFTHENGATHIMEYSHKKRGKPDDEKFFEQSSRALGKAGDVLVFHSDIWHAAGKNQVKTPRRAIAMTFTKPFMKQLVDIPRMIGESHLDNLDHKMRKILGFTTRVPTSLNEWYQPAENRYYLS